MLFRSVNICEVKDSWISCAESSLEFAHNVVVEISIGMMFGADSCPKDWAYAIDEVIQLLVVYATGLSVCSEDVLRIVSKWHGGCRTGRQ